MDKAIVIAAYLVACNNRWFSADETVSTPSLRETFLAEARKAMGDLSERDLCMCLLNLRKAKQLPKKASFNLANRAA